MDPFLIAVGLAAAAAAGAGLRLGSRLLPITLQAYRDLRSMEQSPAAQLRRHAAGRKAAAAPPAGRRRQSSIVGVYDNCLRHADGSYTRLYELELEATMLAEDRIVDRRCDDFARMLCADAPPGAMIQVRYSVGSDPGLALAAHMRERQ